MSILSDQILFLEIVKAIDGACMIDDYVLGFPRCGKMRLCPMHEEWPTIQAQILGTILATTLEDIIEKNFIIYL